MAFEKFTETQRVFRPMVSVWDRGIFSINRAAINKYKLEQFVYVILYYDRKLLKMAMQFTNDRNEEGLRKLNHRKNTNILFSAKPFMIYYGIKLQVKEKFLMEQSKELPNFFVLEKTEE